MEHNSTGNRLPTSKDEACENLSHWIGASCTRCQNSVIDDLLAAWFSLQYLFPGLNPDDAIGDSHDLEPWPAFDIPFPEIEPKYRYRHVNSEWPVAFDELLKEVWNRYETGKIDESELYCLEALKAGLVS